MEKFFAATCFPGIGRVEEGQEQAKGQDKGMEGPWSA
jgi:hypothetical protein